MPEKLYEFLLKLYPDHFRRAYGDEALCLVRDRARSEKGFLSGLRLWLDLLLDLAISVPREFSHAQTTPIMAAQSLNGEGSLHLLPERSLSPTLLCVGGTLTAAFFWVCVFVVSHSNGFPVVLQLPPSLQALVQDSTDPARYPYEEASPIRNSVRNLAEDRLAGQSVPAGAYSFCMTARRDIPRDSVQPLFALNFARPGGSGVAFIDGRVVKRFKDEQRVSIRAYVPAGDHQFVLHLDRPAKNIFVSSNDFRSCQAK
jgi:hypothetical protein